MKLPTYSRVVHGMYRVHLLGSVHDDFELASEFVFKAATVRVQPFRLVVAVGALKHCTNTESVEENAENTVV